MKFVKKDRMNIQSPAVKFKRRYVNLSANIVSEHLLAGNMDFCIDTNFHRKLALRRSIKSIFAGNVALMTALMKRKKHSFFQYLKHIVQTHKIFCINPFRCHGVSEDGFDISQCHLTTFRGHFYFLFLKLKKRATVAAAWVSMEYSGP
jgi:hypothetical protein